MTWAFEVPEVGPGELATEVEFAALFLRAGGRVTLAEWRELSAADAMALVAAGDRLRVQGYADQALAATGTDGMALVSASVDGGELYRRTQLREAVSAAAARIGGVHAPA
jgi:hypothetical protein